VGHEQTYRPRVGACLVGVFFAALGLGFIVYQLYESATMPSSGRPFPVAIFASAGVHLAFGVSLILAWRNSRVVIDDTGIRIINFLGRPAFEARWNEVESVDNTPSQKGNSRRGIWKRGRRPYYVYGSTLVPSDLLSQIDRRWQSH
jgi:hypothetical protein